MDMLPLEQTQEVSLGVLTLLCVICGCIFPWILLSAIFHIYVSVTLLPLSHVLLVLLFRNSQGPAVTITQWPYYFAFLRRPVCCSLDSFICVCQNVILILVAILWIFTVRYLYLMHAYDLNSQDRPTLWHASCLQKSCSFYNINNHVVFNFIYISGYKW